MKTVNKYLTSKNTARKNAQIKNAAIKNAFKLIAAVSAVFLIITQSGCGSKTAEPVSKQSFYLDTVCSITVYDMEEMNEEGAQAAIDEAFKLCSHYESLLSRTKEGSDIYKINHAEGKPVDCDPETVEVIRKGLDYSKMSDGAFDITIGRVTDLWDFHAENPDVPSEEELKKAVSTVNWKNVSIEGNTVTVSDPETHLDLGGIAKGFIADKVGEKLEECGVTSAVISLGGNIVCIGKKPDGKEGRPFRVGIEKPYSEQSEIVGAVDCEDETVVTSGIYQRYFERDGVRYHHILDPATGYPARSDVVGVTLRAPKGRSADCDAMATILLMMRQEKGIKAAEETEYIEAFFITADGSCTCTDGMKLEED